MASASVLQAWERAFKSGSKSLQQKLRAAHGNKPEFKKFLKDQGLETETSVKQVSKSQVDKVKQKAREKLAAKAYGATKGTRMGAADGSGETLRDTIAPLSPEQHAAVKTAERTAKAAAKPAAKPKKEKKPKAPKPEESRLDMIKRLASRKKINNPPVSAKQLRTIAAVGGQEHDHGGFDDLSGTGYENMGGRYSMDESHKVGDLVSYFHQGLGDHLYGRVQTVADDHITMKSGGKTWKVPMQLVHKADEKKVPKYRYDEQVERVAENIIDRFVANKIASYHSDKVKGSVEQSDAAREAVTKKMEPIKRKIERIKARASYKDKSHARHDETKLDLKHANDEHAALKAERAKHYDAFKNASAERDSNIASDMKTYDKYGLVGLGLKRLKQNIQKEETMNEGILSKLLGKKKELAKPAPKKTGYQGLPAEWSQEKRSNEYDANKYMAKLKNEEYKEPFEGGKTPSKNKGIVVGKSRPEGMSRVAHLARLALKKKAMKEGYMKANMPEMDDDNGKSDMAKYERQSKKKGVRAYDKNGKLVGNYRSMEDAKKFKPGHTYKEEVEQLDEIGDTQKGKDALASYIGKAAKALRKPNMDIAYEKGGVDNMMKNIRKVNNRETGIAVAAKKLAKEEVTPTPVHKLNPGLQAKIDAASKKQKPRQAGTPSIDKIKLITREEVEQVDEVNSRHSFDAAQARLTPRAKNVKQALSTKKRDVAATNKYGRVIGKIAGMKPKEVVANLKDMGEETEQVAEVLKPSMGASAYISDFVRSKNAKFAGKSKAERTKMALGAYYGDKKGMKEGLDPVGQEDADVNNDGKHGHSTDKYLLKRRAAISKAMAKKGK
jgi:hypothetical protein